MGTTTIHALPYSEGSEQLSTVDDRMQELAEAIDPKLTPPLQGPLSRILSPSGDLPAGKLGRHYLATDTGVVYLDTGASWIALTEPIGGVSWWAGAGDPPGGTHLVADGRPIARLLYPLYASIIGVTHGGDATNVNLPDMKGRTLVGPDGAGLRIPNSPRALGQPGGAERKTLAKTELPNTSLWNEEGAGGTAQLALGDGYYNPHIGNPYGGQPFSLMQPYLVLTPLVRVR